MKYVNFCLIALGSLILSSGSIKTDKPSIGYHPGEILPNIVLHDAEGKNIDLSEYKGKKVMVNFWAAYDAQSRANNVRIHNLLKNNYPDVTLLSICFDVSRNKGNSIAQIFQNFYTRKHTTPAHHFLQ